MKYCPTCKSTYTDNRLLYCLTDGSALVSDRAYDSEPTLFVGAPPNLPAATNPPSHVVPKEQAAGGARQTVTMVLMLVAGIVIGLLITYILLQRSTTAPMPSNLSANTTNLNNTNISTANTAQAKTKDQPTKQPTTKPSPAPASSASTGDARWFVILGTFDSSDSAGANSRLQKVRAEGFPNAYVVDTNRYSNFTPNKLAVVLGPYTESEARRVGGQVRSVTPTIKPGW